MYLGRAISSAVSFSEAYKTVLEDFSSNLILIDKLPISGPSKAWMYQFPLVSSLQWPFAIYPFAVSKIQNDFGTTGSVLEEVVRPQQACKPRIAFSSQRSIWLWPDFPNRTLQIPPSGSSTPTLPLP